MPRDDTQDGRLRTGGREHDSAMAELSGFQRDLLWMLREHGPCNGLTVEEALEEYYDDTVNHSHVYTNLDQLTEMGFVDKQPGDGRANEYRLTEFASAILERRREWVSARPDP